MTPNSFIYKEYFFRITRRYPNKSEATHANIEGTLDTHTSPRSIVMPILSNDDDGGEDDEEEHKEGGGERRGRSQLALRGQSRTARPPPRAAL